MSNRIIICKKNKKIVQVKWVKEKPEEKATIPIWVNCEDCKLNKECKEK